MVEIKIVEKKFFCQFSVSLMLIRKLLVRLLNVLTKQKLIKKFLDQTENELQPTKKLTC